MSTNIANYVTLKSCMKYVPAFCCCPNLVEENYSYAIKLVIKVRQFASQLIKKHHLEFYTDIHLIHCLWESDGPCVKPVGFTESRKQWVGPLPMGTR